MSFSVSETFTFDPESPIGANMINVPISSEWTAEGPNAPEAAVENGELVYLFSPGLAQQISLFFKVPQTYPSAKQLLMYLAFYTPSTTGNVLFTAKSYLVRRGVDAVSSTTNLRTSSNVAVANTVVANLYTQVTLDLSDTSGLINSTTILGGDMIRIDLTRSASDTDTDIVRIVPSSTEVTYAS